MPLPLVETNLPLVGLRRLTEPSQWVAVAESPANSGLPRKNPGYPSVRPADQRGESAGGFRKVADLRVSCQPQVTRQPPRLTARRRPNRSATFAEQESAADTAGDAVVPTGDGGVHQMRVQSPRLASSESCDLL